MKDCSALRKHLGRLAIWEDGSNTGELMGVTEDSRQTKTDWLFVAINGAVADGLHYVSAAVEKGATVVIVRHEPEMTRPLLNDLRTQGWGGLWLEVSDDYAAFGRAAEWWYNFPGQRLRTTAVTGTNGKTTTAFLLRHLLVSSGLQTGMIGTVCYELGRRAEPADRTTPTPGQLQKLLATMVEDGTTDLVIEASSHSLAQRRLGTMPVEVAIFTNLTQDHGDYHVSFDDYFQSKARLFNEYLKADGLAVINLDDPWGQRLAGCCSRRVVTFGVSAAAEMRVQILKADQAGSTFLLGDDEWHVPLAGSYNVANTAGAILAARHLGLGRDAIREGLASFAGVPGRMEAVPNELGVSILVDYAHTDDAIANALSAVRSTTSGKLICVFGAGGDRDTRKRPAMAEKASGLSDLLILTSDNPRTEDPERILDHIEAGVPEGQSYERISDRRQAIGRAIELAEEGDCILIAGKGHEDYQEVNGVKYPFSDAQVAKDIAARIRFP